ncbi:MAG: TIGR03086 family protein [Actinomycetia bacterium]|nr:TIGR03086 family protein [Actinomycetes bacterium]MCP4959401.1 TIGR03086 family protein [Actinomycetes bacterium]
MAEFAHDHWVRLHRIANAEFDFRVRQILPEWWGASTPCEEWDVYDLVNHCVAESMWVPLLLQGHHPKSIGGLDGDLVEGDPVDVWEGARLDALDAVDDSSAGTEVHLVAGVTSAAEYIRQRTVDMAVHAWDLARAITVDESLDPELVEGVATYVLPKADQFVAGSLLFEPSVVSSPSADPFERVLNLLGREAD